MAINKEVKGRLLPVVNWSKCRSEGTCIEVCPYLVFEMKELTNNQFSKLTFWGKIKTNINGRVKSFVANPDQCIGCGLCFTSCAENAIKLIMSQNK